MAEDFNIERFDPELENEKENNQEKILKKLKKKLSKKRKLDDNHENGEVQLEKENAQVEDAENNAVSPDEASKDGQPPPKKKRRNKKGKKSEGGKETGFTVLGEHMDTKKKKVSRVLPYWLSHPDVVEVDLQSDRLQVDDMQNLDPLLKKKLKMKGISHFFPVQRQIIPILLQSGQDNYLRPNDVCVSAPTGSGKTLAFVLPIIHSLKSRMVPKVRALVLLPTQDLAMQVYKVFNVFCEGTGLRVKLITGVNSAEKEQSDLIRIGSTGIVHQQVDILVATTGRLLFHIRETKHLDLTALRYLVIDEADRMMSSIDDDWLRILESAVYSGKRERPGPLNVANARKRQLPLQKLLFSATLSHDPEKLEQINLFEPKLFRCVVPVKDLEGKVETGEEEITAFSIPAELKQFAVRTEVGQKPLMVSCLVDHFKLSSVLVFTKSNESTHRLALVLFNMGYKAGELSSDLRVKRKKTLSMLRNGKIQILVCSDALARGIDVENLEGVISYDCPQFLKTYIHRVGRTARAGKSGIAITLVESNQEKNLRKMLNDEGVSGVEDFQVDSALLDSKAEQLSHALEKTKRQLQAERDQQQQQKSGGQSGKRKNLNKDHPS